ncbi:MAG: hypothetical protein M3R68_04685 [Acidobacteriota bacterium]|nr:hypothetical protein [Acidobacteriota bacterium]
MHFAGAEATGARPTGETPVPLVRAAPLPLVTKYLDRLWSESYSRVGVSAQANLIASSAPKVFVTHHKRLF